MNTVSIPPRLARTLAIAMICRNPARMHHWLARQPFDVATVAFEQAVTISKRPRRQVAGELRTWALNANNGSAASLNAMVLIAGQPRLFEAAA